MAPIRKRTALRTRAERSARDPRGIYAPPAATSTTPVAEENENASFHSLHHQPPATANTHQNTVSESPFGFSNDDFKLNKKDKRTIKHNALLTKVRDAGVEKKTKRRRPAKKLKADLGGLGDALPDVGEEDDWEGISEDGEEMEGQTLKVDDLPKAKRRRRKQAGDGLSKTMTMKSLTHKPGAMKRKHKMEQGEMERFSRNLAQMVGAGPQGQGAGGVATDGLGMAAPNGSAGQQDKWAALRRFIGGTIEKDKAFAAA